MAKVRTRKPAAPAYPLSFSTLLVFAVLALALRSYVLFLQPMSLFFDEAQYWYWSTQIDWGYYSKPPMVAWLIAATTSVCGEGEACIRLASPFLHTVTALAVYGIAHGLFRDKAVAFYSGLAYLTLPAVSVSSLLISTDPPLLTFWALASWAFINAAQTDRIRWWVMAGVCAGFGMLSKYNMLLLLVSVLAYLFLTKEHKKHLTSPRFWGAVTLAGIIFLPNVLWNLHHGMVSFLHTRDNASGSGLSLQPISLLEFFGAQFGVFGPVMFAVLLYRIWHYKDVMRKKEDRFLLLSVVPLLGIILLVSLLSRAHANWAAPVYVPATVLVVAWLVKQKKQALLTASLALHVVVAVLVANVGLLHKMPGVTWVGDKTVLAEGKIKDPFKRLLGWNDLGEGASILLQAYPEAGLLTDSRKIHAELVYYIRPHPFDAVKWNPTGAIGDHFDLMTDITASGKQDFIFITEREDISDMDPYFMYTDRIGNIEVSPYKDHEINYYAYYLKGFKGYQPQGEGSE